MQATFTALSWGIYTIQGWCNTAVALYRTAGVVKILFTALSWGIRAEGYRTNAGQQLYTSETDVPAALGVLPHPRNAMNRTQA